MARTEPRKIRFVDAPVKDDPLPARDVLAGKPKAGTYALFAAPGYACGVWHCTPGRFHWTFEKDEFVYFLAGRFRLYWPDGRSITVRRGDAAYFPKGRCVCTVTKTVRKVFVIRS